MGTTINVGKDKARCPSYEMSAAFSDRRSMSIAVSSKCRDSALAVLHGHRNGAKLGSVINFSTSRFVRGPHWSRIATEPTADNDMFR